MARKRRRRNPLLTKILVGSVVAHIVILPIAAHFGAFDHVQKQFGESHVVMLTNPAKESDLHSKAKPKQKVKSAGEPKRFPGSKANGHSKDNNLPQPKVVTAGPVGDGGSNSGLPTAESGNGQAGKLPDPPKSVDKPRETVVTKTPTPTETPVPQPLSPPKQEPPKTEIPKPPEIAPKKMIEAEVIEAPQPELPEELTNESLDKTLVVEATINIDGHPTEPRIVTSTGMKTLDQIGLDTAKRYRFRPASINGVPTAQSVRFRIIFKVEQ